TIEKSDPKHTSVYVRTEGIVMTGRGLVHYRTFAVAEPEIVVEGEVERVTFESPTTSFRVLKVAVDGRRGRLAGGGACPPVAVGARVRVRGHIVNDKKHGEQLQAQTVTELTPSTLVGIERYLGSGMIKGVGETFARRIVATFGLETLRVLDEEPHRLG